VEVDRNGLEVLSRDECLRLLGTAGLGRVAVTTAALPTILPVNFRFDGRQILIRTGRGTKLDAATRNAVVAFEVDEVEPATREGWSVVVTGVARELTDPDGGEPPRGGHLDRGGLGPPHRADVWRTVMDSTRPTWGHTESREP
jgi:uncharacterized protein